MRTIIVQKVENNSEPFNKWQAAVLTQELRQRNHTKPEVQKTSFMATAIKRLTYKSVLPKTPYKELKTTKAKERYTGSKERKQPLLTSMIPTTDHKSKRKI